MIRITLKETEALAVQPITLSELIAQLSQPHAYPHPAPSIEVHQTHISVVFLAGDFAYKVKKPVNFGFLDFSTLERRKHFCDQEVRLNRRLAPQVYLGVVPITIQADQLRMGTADSPPDQVVEWAVQMKRLPGEATLENHLLHGNVQPFLLRTLAERLACFHREAERNVHIASFGRFDVVAQNARENFKQTEPHVGVTVSATVYERIRSLTESHLQTHQSLIEARARRGVPCDTHGDLRLDHVYFLPENAPPNDLLLIDCIEFNDRFRFGDPALDVAFLVMDLAFHGRRDLDRVFAEAYFQAAQDPEGALLLPLYIAYRAVVRAKVEGMELSENEIDPAEHAAARQRARAHWLLALGELESPLKRPALVMIGGLPGTGKSTLARTLANLAHFDVLRSDEIRKELAGITNESSDSSPLRQEIYEASWTQRTYEEIEKRAEKLWEDGERVIVDANFREESQREQLLDAAHRWGIPALFLHCRSRPETIRERLQRRHGDASDADWATHQALAETWQAFGPVTARHVRELDTSGASEETLRQAWRALRQAEPMLFS